MFVNKLFTYLTGIFHIFHISACAPSQTSHLSPLPIKSNKHLFWSSTQACQSISSQNQVFNSTSLFQVSELPFQCNATATLTFTIILLRSSAVCIFMLNHLFNFILLTCSSCLILNFNILIYILLTVSVFIKIHTKSAGFLFRLMEIDRSLIILILEFILIFQYSVIFNKMTFSNINLLNKVLLIVVLVFLKVKIRKAFCCNIVNSKDLLGLNYFKSYLCQLIRKFSNFSQFYLSLVNFFCIHMKCILVFLHYATPFILVIAIVFCQSNLFWDCANGFVNIFRVHNDFNAINNSIRF